MMCRRLIRICLERKGCQKQQKYTEKAKKNTSTNQVQQSYTQNIQSFPIWLVRWCLCTSQYNTIASAVLSKFQRIPVLMSIYFQLGISNYTFIQEMLEKSVEACEQFLSNKILCFWKIQKKYRTNILFIRIDIHRLRSVYHIIKTTRIINWVFDLKDWMLFNSNFKIHAQLWPIKLIAFVLESLIIKNTYLKMNVLNRP